MAKKPERVKANDLFKLVGAIKGDQSKLFAGRQSVMNRLMTGFEADGLVPVIYGDRGLGKSSVGQQAFSLLSGDGEVEERFDYLGEIDYPDDCACFWVECIRDQDFATTLLRLLLPSSAVPVGQAHTFCDAFPDAMPQEQEKIEKSLQVRLGILQLQIGSKGDKASPGLEDRKISEVRERGYADPFLLFSTVAERIKRRVGDREIVVFFDEMDRLADKKGAGDFIKLATGVRLAFIGVSETTGELIEDHESIERKLHKVHVPVFERGEIAQIYQNAQQIASEYGNANKLVFDQAMVDRAAEDSGGYPYLAQNFGYWSLKASKAMRRLGASDVVIGLSEYEEGLRYLFSPKSDGHDIDFVDTLKKSIGRSEQKAEILKIASESDLEWLDVDELRRSLSQNGRKGFHDNLEALIRNRVLRKSVLDPNRIKFDTPYLRLAYKLGVRYSLL